MTVAERMRRDRRLAREFTRSMFKLRFSEEPMADRLVLTTKDGKDMGGWGQPAFMDQVVALLAKAAARRLARKGKR